MTKDGYDTIVTDMLRGEGRRTQNIIDHVGVEFCADPACTYCGNYEKELVAKISAELNNPTCETCQEFNTVFGKVVLRPDAKTVLTTEPVPSAGLGYMVQILGEGNFNCEHCVSVKAILVGEILSGPLGEDERKRGESSWEDVRAKGKAIRLIKPTSVPPALGGATGIEPHSRYWKRKTR